MNLFESCNQFKQELKENFGLEVEIIPTFSNDKELGFTMASIATPDEKMATFHFDPTKKCCEGHNPHLSPIRP